MSVNNAIGWAVVFATLLILADIPATEQIASSFSWLLLISVLIAFGPAAFATISGVSGASAAVPYGLPPGTSRGETGQHN
jgi:hypothetical protein